MVEKNAPQVLLVEDNPGEVELILRSLKEGDPQPLVRVARDGKEAIDLLLGEHSPGAASPAQLPALVLLDLKLPRIDGLEALRKIKGDERTRAVPVIVFSSSRERRDVIRCYRLGANAFVQKPADFEGFREAVRRLKAFWLNLNEPPPMDPAQK